MKKLFCASCLLAMILFSGCGVPVTPAQTNSISSVADDTTQTASIPHSSDLPQLSYGISDDLLEKAGETLAAHPSLPVYQLEPVLLDENEAFQTLSGQKADDTMDVSSWSYPDNEGNAVLMRSGLEPFYDYWLDIQCFTNRGTDLFYQTQRSYSIDAVFYPPEDAESQMEGNLSFSDRDTVQSAFVSLFAPYGTVGDLSCYSLSAHDLQKLYDRRKSEGSLRSERYSVGGDRKDAEQIAEKAKWTEEDALYYITASQLLSGVPYYGSEIEAWIDNQGWIKLSVSSFAAAKETSGSKPLAELSAILRSINDLTADLYSDHTDVIELALYYYRMPKKHVGKYSLGMRQRLGLAQALMDDPDILILDEPMNGLDQACSDQLRALLKQLAAQGKTIVIASHYAEDLQNLCGKIYTVVDGYIK